MAAERNRPFASRNIKKVLLTSSKKRIREHSAIPPQNH
jgi:hypothetical protein